MDVQAFLAGGCRCRLTSAEKAILTAVADRRTADLGRTLGLTPTGLRAALQRLAARGLEVRSPVSRSASGAPVYAYRGRARVYVLPDLAAHVRSCKGDARTSPSIPRPRRVPLTPVAPTVVFRPPPVQPLGDQIQQWAARSAVRRVQR